MSISKKLAAVVSAAAVVASMFAAAPANAETTQSFVNRTVQNNVQRDVDPTNHTVKFYAGEYFSLYYGAAVNSQVLSAKVAANSVVTVDAGFSVVSGTLPTSYGKSVSMNGAIAGVSFNEYLAQNATELKLTKTLSAAPTNLNVNINISGIATTDMVLAFNPTVKIDSYTVVAGDFNYENNDAGSRAGGTWNPVQGKSRVARAEDTAMDFYTERVCVNATNLVNGDVLESTFSVSDGTSTVGEAMPYWTVQNAEGMSNGPGVDGATYTFESYPAGYRLLMSTGVTINAPVAGKTYTASEFKIVKQGTTENLITSCATSAATGTIAATGSTITLTIDKAGDASNMGPGKFDGYACLLYAAADTARATVLKYTQAMAMGMGGPNAGSTITCGFMGVAAGTYAVGFRGVGWKGFSEEIAATGTVTVGGAAVKKAPKAPTVATKAKVGKTFTVALHATKGTAAKGANADGLATVVSVAPASKAFCSVTKAVKAGKITGYTVKGLKAGKCSVVVTITGSATYNALTKTVVVTVAK